MPKNSTFSENFGALVTPVAVRKDPSGRFSSPSVDTLLMLHPILHSFQKSLISLSLNEYDTTAIIFSKTFEDNNKMRLSGYRSAIVFHALVITFLLTQGASAEKASCTDFSKGEFGPETIVSDENCQVACQLGEGLPVGRFKSDEGGYAECTCLKIEENGSASETRDLCLDGTPSGAGRLGMGLVTVATTAMLVAAMSV